MQWSSSVHHLGKSFEVCDSFILDAKLNLLLCKINDEYFGGNSVLLKRKKNIDANS